MYTPAPRVVGNGALFATQANNARIGPWETFVGALSDLHVFNYTYQVPMGYTLRANCQSGIVGYKKYRPTSYSVLYQSWRKSGYCSVVVKNGGAAQYQSHSFQIGLGYTGFHDTGFDDNLRVFDHEGTSFEPEAVANRALALNLYNRTIVEAKNKATREGMDLAETLTGIPESVRMIAGRVKQVTLAWKHVRNRNITAAVRSLGINPTKVHHSLKNKSLAKAWLELQYGWLPLLSDIHSGMNLVNGLLSKEQNPRQFSVRRRLGTELIGRLPVSPRPAKWTGLQLTSAGHHSVEVRYDYRVDDATVAFLSGLSILNPLYVGWVAAPFSFVLDWLLPVADWLQSLTSHLGLQFVSGYATRKSYGRATASASGIEDYGPFYPRVYSGGSTSAVAEMVRMTRTAFLSPPTSYLYFRFPLSSDKRVASAISLVITTRKGI